jgi:probable rRNA maturation factor
MSSREDRSRRSLLSVSIADALGRPVPAPGLARWLARVAPKRARGVVTLALVGDRHVRALNRRYRGIDQVTDVLSFATGPEDRRITEGESAVRQRPSLGDVVIATGMAARQARMAGHSVATEFRILALHGLLHLLGYDHELDDGHMARLERTLRRRGGLGAGLIDRHGPRPPRQRSRSRAPTIQ